MSERLTHITIIDKDNLAHLLPGEITHDEKRNVWFIGCPGCTGVGNLARHDVTYDEKAGILTVSPSILCSCGAHYFVERNQIRWC